METDATPQTAAPAETGQPAAPAVEGQQQLLALPTDQSQAPAPDASAPVIAAAQPPDEVGLLRERYKHSSEESIRLYKENERLRTEMQAKATPPAQTYNPEQLETWKEQRLVEMTQAAASGDTAKVQEAARQIRLIDSELRNQSLRSIETKTTQQTELQALTSEVQPILEQHKADLQPGMPVHTAANALYGRMLKSGAPDNMFTANAAVILALAQSGKLNAAEASKASHDATKTLNQAIKGAAAAGSGAANTNAAASPDFKKMTPVEFRAYRKSLGVQV